MSVKSYTVFARRFRPVTFDEVVGQEHVATTLKNAIEENRVGHAYLFSGPRGVGKTSMARIFARALNCKKGPTTNPCGKCEACSRIHEGTDSDVIELDAASNRGVDDARQLREGVRYAPLRSATKVYIIDEAHMLTREAFNTLLKTLEEPPPHVKFILATTEIHKFPDTITSRCQRFEFRRITTRDIAKRLDQISKNDNQKIDEQVLGAVARAGKGSMRDAQSLLDQLVAFKESNLSREDVSAMLGSANDQALYSLVDAIAATDSKSVIETIDKVFAAGVDGTSFLDQLLEHFRSLLLIRACGKEAPVIDLPDAELEATAKQSEKFSLEALLYAIQLTLESRRRVREGADVRLILEVTGVKLSRIGDLVSLGEALQGLDRAPAATRPAKNTRAVPPEPAPHPPQDSSPASEEEEAVPTEPAPRQEQPSAGDPWKRVVDTTRATSVLAGTLLSEGRVTKTSATEVRFLLPSKFTLFHVEQLTDNKNRTLIEGALEKVYGRKLAFHPTLEKGTPGPAARPQNATDALTGDPAVKKVLGAFPGSKIVGIE